MTGPTPPPPGAGTPPAEPARKPRNRRLRLWLALGAGVLTLLCLGGVGIAVLLYDEDTKIERAKPDVVAESFLRAYLVNRSDEEAALYQCKTDGDFAQIAAFRDDIVKGEQEFSLGIRVTWTSLVVIQEGGQTVVTTELRRAFTDGSERVSEPWRFSMVDQDGWRVCGAAKLA